MALFEETPALSSRASRGQKLDFTAKEMRHARNIDDQAIRPIFRSMWSVTAGPSAQTFKRPALPDQIGWPRGEDRTDGARIGQGHAAMELRQCRCSAFGARSVNAKGPSTGWALRLISLASLGNQMDSSRRAVPAHIIDSDSSLFVLIKGPAMTSRVQRRG